MSSLPVLTKTNAQNIFRAYANKINQGGGGGGGEQFQYTTMPAPSAQNEGKVYQYIGDTVGQFNGQNWYVPGEFYKCIQDENENYIWDSLMTQICDSDLSSFQFPDDLTEKCYFRYRGVSQSPAPRKLFIFVGGAYIDMTSTMLGMNEIPTVNHIPTAEDFGEANAMILLCEMSGQSAKLFLFSDDVVIEITPEMFGIYIFDHALPSSPVEYDSETQQPMYVLSSQVFTLHNTDLSDGFIYLKSGDDLYPFIKTSAGSGENNIHHGYIPLSNSIDIFNERIIEVQNADGTELTMGVYIKYPHGDASGVLLNTYYWMYKDLEDCTLLESSELPQDADPDVVYYFMTGTSEEDIVVHLFVYSYSSSSWVESVLTMTGSFVNGFPSLDNYEIGSAIIVSIQDNKLKSMETIDSPILFLRASFDERNTPSWEVVSGGGSSLPDAEDVNF